MTGMFLGHSIGYDGYVYHLCVILFTGGGLSLSQHAPQVTSPGDLCPGRVSVHGGGSLSRGVSVRETSRTETSSPYSNERAVRILLECILLLGYSLGYDGYAERLGHGADVFVTVGVTRAFLRVAPVDRQRRDAARLDHSCELHGLLNLSERKRGDHHCEVQGFYQGDKGLAIYYFNLKKKTQHII